MFVRPSFLEGFNPNRTINLERKEIYKKKNTISLHELVDDILEIREGKSHRDKFLDTLMEAYVKCADYLLKKMPLKNPVLQGCSVLDPLIRTADVTQEVLIKLQNFSLLVDQDKTVKKAYVEEVESYTTADLPRPMPDTAIDK